MGVELTPDRREVSNTGVEVVLDRGVEVVLDRGVDVVR